MAWNAPGGNDQKDPWKDSKNQVSSLEKNVNDFFSKFMNDGDKGPDSKSLLLIALVVGVLWFLSGLYLVNEKERGVVLRFGKYHETVTDGLNWNPKLIDQIKIFNVTQVTPLSITSTMLTTDQNIVDIDLSIQYRIAEPEKFWLKVQEPSALLMHTVESSLRHVVGATKMDEVLTVGREKVADDIHTRLRNLLDKYNTGIEIDRVNITSAQPPKEVRSAFEDVVKASEDKKTIINQADTFKNGLLPEARGEAQAQLSAAQAYKEQVIAESEGEASHFSAIQKEYAKAPRVTRQRLYVDAVEKVMKQSTKVMVDVKGGNNMMYLPLDKILQQHTSNSNASNFANEAANLTKTIKSRVSSEARSRIRESR